MSPAEAFALAWLEAWYGTEDRGLNAADRYIATAQALLDSGVIPISTPAPAPRVNDIYAEILPVHFPRGRGA